MSEPAAQETSADRPEAAAGEPAGQGELLLDDLLVEEISIDGMCGVY